VSTTLIVTGSRFSFTKLLAGTMFIGQFEDFINAVASGLEEEFPDRKLITYAYLDYIDPPAQTRVHPNVIVMIAPLDNPDELDPVLDEAVQGWRDMGAHKLYWYGYILNRPPVPHLIGEWFRNYKRLGVDGVYLEFSRGTGAFSALNSAVYTKLMWDPEANVDDVIDAFCMRLFGPQVGDQMRRFFLAWEIGTPYSQEDIPRLLAAAKQLAGDPDSVIAKRVRLFTLGYELWHSSLELDAALKFNDIPQAVQAVQAGLDAHNALRSEYPGLDMQSYITFLNYASVDAYEATVMPALQTLLHAEAIPRSAEPPLPGPALCLTDNADLHTEQRMRAGVNLANVQPQQGDRIARKLFDGVIADDEHTIYTSAFPLLTVTLDLQQPYQIDRVEVCTGTQLRHQDFVTLVQTVPIYVEVQASDDGTNFTTIDRILPRTLRGYVSSDRLLVTARYVRLTSASLNMKHQIDEIRVWGRTCQ
jgi:hypothetical protein